ncbi:MAG: hypothetical protein WBC94_12590 [Xanthobacteraceae bacterium]
MAGAGFAVESIRQLIVSRARLTDVCRACGHVAYPGRGCAMSVLERFVRMRQFRRCAADYYDLALGSFGTAIRARYLAIADHYVALADAELRSDRLERKSRLAEMQAMRAAAAHADRDSRPAPATLEPVKLRIIQGDGPGTGKRRITLPARSNLTMARHVTKRDR